MNLVELYRYQSPTMTEDQIRAVQAIMPDDIEREIDTELTRRGLKRISIENTLFSTEPKYSALPNKMAHCIILNKPCQIENNIRLAMIYLDNISAEEIVQSFPMMEITPLAVSDPNKKRLDSLRWEMDRRSRDPPKVQKPLPELKK